MALSVMDRKLLTASPFPEMEHQFPTELIFPSVVRSLNRAHLMVFDNCTKKVSKQNERKKKKVKNLSGLHLLFVIVFCFYGLSWDHKNNSDIKA